MAIRLRILEGSYIIKGFESRDHQLLRRVLGKGGHGREVVRFYFQVGSLIRFHGKSKRANGIAQCWEDMGYQCLNFFAHEGEESPGAQQAGRILRQALALGLLYRIESPMGMSDARIWSEFINIHFRMFREAGLSLGEWLEKADKLTPSTWGSTLRRTVGLLTGYFRNLPAPYSRALQAVEAADRKAARAAAAHLGGRNGKR